MDSYTLSNLNEDFGIEIKDELFGISIKDLKNVAIKQLPSAIENKFATISADELRNVDGMNLEEELGDILEKTNTYYFNSEDSKLYKDSTFTTEVSFDYTISQDKSKVTTKGHETSIISGEAKIELWYLPLTIALGDFTSDLDTNMTLHELEESFDITLPSFFDNVDKENTKVSELSDTINNLHVADILGYTIDITNPEQPKVMDGTTEIKGVLAAVAQYKINQLESGVAGLKLSQIFKPEQLNSGILSLLTTDPTIDQIPAAIENVIKTTNIQTLYSEGIIALNVEDANKLDDPIDHDNNNSTAEVEIGSLTIEEFLDYCFDYVL
jgi:hypothetical protein